MVPIDHDPFDGSGADTSRAGRYLLFHDPRPGSASGQTDTAPKPVDQATLQTLAARRPQGLLQDPAEGLGRWLAPDLTSYLLGAPPQHKPVKLPDGTAMMSVDGPDPDSDPRYWNFALSHQPQARPEYELILPQPKPQQPLRNVYDLTEAERQTLLQDLPARMQAKGWEPLQTAGRLFAPGLTSYLVDEPPRYKPITLRDGTQMLPPPAYDQFSDPRFWAAAGDVALLGSSFVAPELAALERVAGTVPTVGRAIAGTAMEDIPLASRSARIYNPPSTNPRLFEADYPDYFPKHTAYGTYEAIPGAMTGHLPDLPQASEAERAAYSRDPRSAWRTGPNDRDAIYQALEMHQRPSVSATGQYTPPGGKLETNPAGVARPMVGLDPGPPRGLDDPSRALMTNAEATRAYIDAQGMGAWSKPIVEGIRQKDANSVTFPTGAPLTLNQVVALRDYGQKLGLPNVIDQGERATLTNLKGAPSGRDIARGLAQNDLQKSFPGAKPEIARLDSDAISYENEWARGEGSGAVTRKLQSILEANPEILRKLDGSQEIRRIARDRLQRDIDYARQTGQPLRPDVQRAREIIGTEGPFGGFTGLFAALRRGEALPAVLVPVLASVLAGSATGTRQGNTAQ
jgi:hypothetical protein